MLNLSRTTISEISDLKIGPDNLNDQSFSSYNPSHIYYIRLILKVIKYGNINLELIYFVRSYCICTPQSFVTNCFLIFIIYEVKNFATNNNQSSCQSQSCTGIHAKELVTDWRFVRQARIVVKFLILVIAWLLISRFLGIVILNSPGGAFALQEVFPIC